MKVFELINPSDQVTLEAPDLSIAAFAALALSSWYGVRNDDDDDAEQEEFFQPIGSHSEFESRWGPSGEFLDTHAAEIADCLDSFAYVSAGERARYTLALELIDDPAKREQFRAAHDDRERSSLNQICRHAWELAAMIRRKLAADSDPASTFHGGRNA